MFHKRRPRPPYRHRLQPGQEAALVLKLARALITVRTHVLVGACRKFYFSAELVDV